MLGKLGSPRCALSRPYCVAPTLIINGVPQAAGLTFCYKCATSVLQHYVSEGFRAAELRPVTAQGGVTAGSPATARGAADNDATPRCAVSRPDCSSITLKVTDFHEAPTFAFEMWVCVGCFHDVVALLSQQGKWVRVGNAINTPDARWLTGRVP